MLKADQIPDEVVEAAARVLAACHSTEANWEIFLPRARAAIAAAINAWPGFEYRANGAFPAFGYGPEAIVLPLPQEAGE